MTAWIASRPSTCQVQVAMMMRNFLKCCAGLADRHRHRRQNKQSALFRTVITAFCFRDAGSQRSSPPHPSPPPTTLPDCLCLPPCPSLPQLRSRVCHQRLHAGALGSLGSVWPRRLKVTGASQRFLEGSIIVSHATISGSVFGGRQPSASRNFLCVRWAL